MMDDDLPAALTLLPDEEEQVDILEILYCRAVPILAALCAKDSLGEERISAFSHRMEGMFPSRPVRDEIMDAVCATMELPQEFLPYFVNYLFRATRPFLDDANALAMSRMVLFLAKELSDEGWQVLLSYGSQFFLTKEMVMAEPYGQIAT